MKEEKAPGDGKRRKGFRHFQKGYEAGIGEPGVNFASGGEEMLQKKSQLERGGATQHKKSTPHVTSLQKKTKEEERGGWQVFLEIRTPRTHAKFAVDHSSANQWKEKGGRRNQKVQENCVFKRIVRGSSD